MIKLMILSGPFAGRTRIIPADMKPDDLFRDLLAHGWKWEVDYSQATTEEHWNWARHDLAIRLVEVLRQGQAVRFMGQEYRGLERVGDLEDAIAESKRMVSWKYHDWGLEVTVHGWEQ